MRKFLDRRRRPPAAELREVAVRHLLDSPTIAARTHRHIVDGVVDWPGLAAEAATMSSGERRLLGIAQDLWSGRSPNRDDLSRRLDPGDRVRVDVAMKALGARARDVSPPRPAVVDNAWRNGPSIGWESLPRAA